MTSSKQIAFAVSPQEAAARLPGVEFHSVELADGGRQALAVALPLSYGKKKRRQYPLLVLLDATHTFGSAVEMTRLMAQTKELRESIVVALFRPTREGSHSMTDLAAVEAVLHWSRSRYRVGGGCVVYGEGNATMLATLALLARLGVTEAIVHAADAAAMLPAMSPGLEPDAPVPPASLGMVVIGTSGALLEDLRRQLGPAVCPIAVADDAPGGWGIPGMITALRTLWSTRIPYGANVGLLQRRGLWPVFRALSPLFRKLALAAQPELNENLHRIRSDLMDREFELFVSLPQSLHSGSTATYPLLLVLDANIEFATVAEAAAALADIGAMRETIVVGLGTPRSEGATAFAYRRFEEFSPPLEGYDFEDSLGRFFCGFYALRGLDARDQLGRAPLFHRCLTEEVLPRLLRSLPVDNAEVALLGHSAGGTLACYSMLQPDSPFTGYVVVSPGIGISGYWLRRHLQKGARPAARARTAVLSIGSAEERNAFNIDAGIPETAAWADLLRKSGSLKVHYQRYGGETHSSTYPCAVATALLTMFPIMAAADSAPVALEVV